MTLRPGKLPAEELAELLRRVHHRDHRVIAGPGIGRDAAVIDIGGRLIVAKTDPVTFATEHIGWYAVNVNANDIACMGARPSWFMATALLPGGAPRSLPGSIMDDLVDACERLGIELVGGHTEVTLGIERPIVVGAMLGEASPEEIVLGENIVPGDVVLLTKGVAIEGTALLAREAGRRLADHGMAQEAIERAKDLLFDPGISVVADASALTAVVRPRLMHDATEGGLATALGEMAAAAGRRLRIDYSAVPVVAETRVVCNALGLDPMGLLASGALLAIVDGDDAAPAIDALASINIVCQAVGRVEGGDPAVIMAGGPGERPFPEFARDELARFFDEED